jgi:purine-cytosine permease-like protein
MKIPKIIRWFAIITTTSAPISLMLVLKDYNVFQQWYDLIWQFTLVWFGIYYFRFMTTTKKVIRLDMRWIK